MDSNSNSLDMCWPKIEVDSENESPKRETRLYWTPENTMKLIDTLEKECKELWDMKHPLNKDRNARQAKQEYLANVFGTTPEEISRKIHNLRTQLNNELRKIKRRQAAGGSAGGSGSGGSGWEYFDALSFLLRVPSGDPLETVDGVNLALAEFQADEEEEFGIPSASTPYASSKPTKVHQELSTPKQHASSNSSPLQWTTRGVHQESRTHTSCPMHRAKPVHRVAASAPLPLAPPLWPEEPVPRPGPSANNDDCQIFGDFVASELRTLRSGESRKKLKRMIQKAILQVGEEEDVDNA